MTRRRLDAELARRGLANSREHAQGLIAEGSVAVKGVVAVKAATMVDDADAIEISASAERFVSRGALKLIGALEAFAGLNLVGRRALDAGASTGGFTEVLLGRGVDRVLAVDVGYGQLAWALRQDPRVDVLERTNVRYLQAEALPWIPDLVVADLSFISLRLVIPALVACSAQATDFILMVKPQFEVGREQVADGVVRDTALRRRAVASIADASVSAGLRIRGVTASPLPGPSGNVEYFLWSSKSGHEGGVGPDSTSREMVGTWIDRAIEQGPA